MKSGKQLLVHLLSALFGISAWIAINGLWQQTPLLVSRLPEAWNLASYITLITQLANVGPLLYSLLKRLFGSPFLERLSIHAINWIGIVALVLQIFFWDHISVVGSKEHSVAFLTLTFFLAIVDCTSSVLYIPFMSSIASNYLVSHLVGQSLSGLLPSFLALAQGVGGNPDCHQVNGTQVPVYPSPRFSVNVFFGLLTLLAIISWFAFFLLSNLKRFFAIDVTVGESSSRIAVETDKLQPQQHQPYQQQQHHHPQESSSLSTRTLLTLLITEACICCITNGLLPPIQPYSVLVYGNVAYHFVVSLSAIASASGTYCSGFLNARQAKVLPVLLALAVASAGFILASALSSPSRLVTGGFGSVLIVCVWVANNALFAFCRASITRLLRAGSSQQKQSHRYLFLGGVFTQIGSAVGAIVMFCVINYTSAFKSFSPCS